MAPAQTFGRRAAAPALTAAVVPAPLVQSELSPEAQAFASALRGAPRVADDELALWRKAHRGRMWAGAGPWKYWAAILGALSMAGDFHDFGPYTEASVVVLRVMGAVCGIVAFWRGLRSKGKS